MSPDDLEPLIGTWRSEMFFLGQTLAGEASFERLDPGGLVLMRSHTIGADLPPTAAAVIGFDDSSERWTMAYHDDRGVSRLYDMTFDGAHWTLTGKPADFHQRFRATLAPDRIDGAWEKSDDGESWSVDFRVVYNRI